MNVAVVGASDKPDRYSYKAVKLLLEKGHTPLPVHPRIKTIDGLKVYPSIKDIEQPIDTVSLYVASDVSDLIIDEILLKKPNRIIFNPGAENAHLAEKANALGIQTLNACTLVMLKTGQF
jgi:predicted CoA-binding protein